MPRRHRIVWVAVALLLVGLPALAVTCALLGANTGTGRRWIEEITVRASHGEIVLQGLSGRFPDRLHLATLQMSDPKGVWLEAQDIELDTAPLALLDKRAQVQRFAVAHLSISRRPDYGPSAPSQGKSKRSLIDEIRIDTLQWARVDLGADLTGTPSAFRIIGSAKLRSLHSARLELSAQRLDSVPCTYEAHLALDGRQVNAAADVQEGSGGALTQLARVPDLGPLALHVRLQGPRGAVQTLLHLQAGPLVAEVAGSVNLDELAADLKVDATSAAIRPMFGISWQALSLHGELRGTPSSPDASAQLRLVGLTAPGAQTHDIEASVHSAADQVVLDASVHGITLQSSQLILPRNKPLILHAQSKLNDKALPVDFSVASTLIDAHGHWNVATGDGTVSANLVDIHPLMAIGGADLQGHGRLEAKFNLSGNAGRLDTQADLNVTGGAAPLASLLRPRTRAVATLLFRPEGLQFKDARIDAAHAQLSLHGTMLEDGMNLQYQASLPELAALSPQVAGKVKAYGTIRGKSPNLEVDGDVTGELSTHGTPSGPLHLIVHAHDLPRHTNGSLQLNGRLDGAPINLAATASATPEGDLIARIERGDWKSFRIDGNLRSDAKGEHAKGRLALRMTELKDLDRVLGEPIQGNLNASVLLADSSGGDRAEVNVEAHDVGLPSQLVHELQLRGHIDRPLTQPNLALELRAIAQLNDRAAQLVAQAHGPLNKLELNSRVHLDALGEGEDAASAAAQFEEHATLDVGRSQLRLTALDADYRKANLHLLGPALIDYGSELKVDQLRLASAEAEMTVAGRLSPTLALRVNLRNLSAAQLRVLVPSLAIDGQLNAKADLSGELEHPSGHLEMHAANLRSGAMAHGLPATNVDLKAELADTAAQVDLQMHAGQGVGFALIGKLPMSAQGQMDAKAGGAFDLNLLNPMLEAQGQHVQGSIRINAHLTGTGRAPQAHGTVMLAGVNVQDYARGARLTDLQATVNADGETLTLQQLSARAGPGTVTADGTVKLGNSDWPVNLKVTGRNAQLLASDLATANLDFDARVAGALRTQLTTEGTVHINRAVINIPNALPPDLPTVRVVRPGQRAAPPPASTGPTVALDYRISAQHAIFVRGRGIDSEFAGGLHVHGTTDKLAISGGFDMVKGSIALGGTTLQFDRDSRLSFNGSACRTRLIRR
jgi:translocation and assembly module TamB